MVVERITILNKMVRLTISTAPIFTSVETYTYEEGADGDSVLPEGVPGGPGGGGPGGIGGSSE